MGKASEGSQSGIVIPVHNRRELTLRCLGNLRETDVFSWAEIIVVDDGSTDGTGDAIRRDFPDATVLDGSGDLWWGGAIRKGMLHAISEGCAFLFFLNDDCLPEQGCLELLRERCQATNRPCTAQASTPSGWIYGGVRKGTTKLHPLRVDQGREESCDAFMGNCACIPVSILQEVDGVDATAFPHGMADVDLGLRMTAAGHRSLVVGNARAKNEDNLGPTVKSWLLDDVPLSKIWGGLFDLKSSLHLRTHWRFTTRHWKAFGILLFFKTYCRLLGITLLRLVFPRRFLLKHFRSRSFAWKAANSNGGSGPNGH